jgi:D-lactate dehydrogenase (cytochrome)
VPIIAFGAGTSLEGHLNAPHGGLSLDLTRMNKILAVHQEDLDCVVEAGVTRGQLNEHLRGTGLFFPVDPGADATLGGMAATRASGTNAVRYGTMRDAVLNLTAVMADGSVVRTARRARKSSAGYDLTHLLVGSEGTLGIITELTLRLHGIPESILSAVCPFKSVQGACDATIMAIQLGLGLARIEFLDEVQIEACNAHSKLDLPIAPTLFLEFHGTKAATREQVETFSEIAGDNGGGDFQWAERAEDRNKLWAARHDAYWAARTYRPGAQIIATDVCVPISRLAECVVETQKDIAEMGLVAPIVGHIGDGNFHVLPLIDMDNSQEVEAAHGFLDRLVGRALEMDGTCTGEHGVGTGKMKYMLAEHGPGIEVMRAIKKTLDPHNIFNPGKVVDVT